VGDAWAMKGAGSIMGPDMMYMVCNAPAGPAERERKWQLYRYRSDSAGQELLGMVSGGGGEGWCIICTAVVGKNAEGTVVRWTWIIRPARLQNAQRRLDGRGEDLI